MRTLKVVEFPAPPVVVTEYVPAACHTCLGGITRLDDGHVICDDCGTVYQVEYLMSGGNAS